MTDTKILNSKTADSSSKIIFEDNILCAQFLRDYIDLPCLKDVKPEDIEDISEQFVPLFAEERNADRVKRVNIKNENPFFLVSIVEHKSQLDYNVIMQIFRYMVYIWERYEREAEKIHKGITKRADFKYPPIIPIVYYEGIDNWTVPLDFKSRIMEGDMFGKYIPNFEYYLVPLRKYSNEELLAKKDEISLVMMINRMQNENDIEEFRNLPAEEMEKILRETPEHLLTLISDVLRTFLLKMNISVEQTEELVGKVKEKKMGILFEHVVPFDIERTKREAEAIKQEAEKIKHEVEVIKRQSEEVKRQTEEAKRQTEEAKRQTEEAKRQTEETQMQLENSIRIYIETCREFGLVKENLIQKMAEKYGMEEQEILAKIDLYWKE